MPEALDFAVGQQPRYSNGIGDARRRPKGQVFTPPEVARFMAGVLSNLHPDFRLLDPGAGVGCLTAAVADRFSALTTPGTLEAHCFENDEALLAPLRETLEHCQAVLSNRGHTFRYVIHATDFIADQSSILARELRLFHDTDLGQFDVVIMNPPYFKLRKDSKHARLMADVVHGQPNAYALFLMLGAELLKDDGELIAITPRSFCNGLYFRSFRRRFFGRMRLEHAHLFESRTETFRESNVLQESLITKTRRTQKSSDCVTVTSTVGREMQSATTLSVPTREIFDPSDHDLVVRIPITQKERELVRAVEALPTRFSDLGLGISTGPVVLFRATEFLLSAQTQGNAIALLMPHNVTGMLTTWPRPRANKPQAFKLCDRSRRLTTRTGNYVLLKRFSAKEERRRLVASYVFARDFDTSLLAIENHLNYIYHSDRDLSEDEVVGIAAVLNSKVVDRYYRTISGNTQVNATDVRNLPFPTMESLRGIGRKILAAEVASADLDEIVLDVLGIDRDSYAVVSS